MHKHNQSKCGVTRHAPNWASLTLLLFVLITLTSCASVPQIITETKTETVFVPVRTPLDAGLFTPPVTLPCIIPATEQLYFFDLDQWALCLESENRFFKRQVKKIKQANEKPPEGG